METTKEDFPDTFENSPKKFWWRRGKNSDWISTINLYFKQLEGYGKKTLRELDPERHSEREREREEKEKKSGIAQNKRKSPDSDRKQRVGGKEISTRGEKKFKGEHK